MLPNNCPMASPQPTDIVRLDDTGSGWDTRPNDRGFGPECGFSPHRLVDCRRGIIGNVRPE